MPLVAFHLLPVLQEGEGLEIEGENEANDGVTINIVNRQDTWTLVQKRKQNKKKKDTKSKKWNRQQRENFECFGNIWYQEPYKSYQTSEVSPPSCKHASAAAAPATTGPSARYIAHTTCRCCCNPPPYQYCSSSLLCRCARLHQKVENVPSLRPFQKKMSGLSQEKKDLWTFYLLYPRMNHQITLNSWKHNWDDQHDDKIVIILTTSFERLFNVWPFHRIEVNAQGCTRY
jgi:hypothetical protein